MKCPACHWDKGTEVILKEYMFKTLEEFAYIKCEKCKTVYMRYPSMDMAKYYPEGYCAYTPTPDESIPLWKIRWRFLKGLIKPIHVPMLYVDLRTSARILDFGAGSGSFALDLFQTGFAKTRAIDRFTPNEPSYYGGRLKVELKSTWHFGAETFDYITANHSLEHVPNPYDTLVDMKRILKVGGTILIRVPFVDSPTAKQYGEFWCGYDPPRHLVNFTTFGLKLMAKRAGLKPYAISYDQQLYTIFLSELWKKGKSIDGTDVMEEFGQAQMQRWQAKCTSLNKNSQGCTGGIYLRKESG